MKRRTKRVIVFLLLPVVGYLLFYCLTTFYAGGLFHAITFGRRFNTLMHRTDYQALLAACRTLIDEGYRGKYVVHWINPHPDVKKFPKEILALKPTYVVVGDQRVHIELWGGMSHYGVNAYAEDFNEPDPEYYYGDKELIDGLWFYSDLIKPENLDAFIEKMDGSKNSD
jgi:hypothetical protein